MARASEKASTVPARLIAGLHRAGMLMEDISQVYGLSPNEIAQAVSCHDEPIRIDDLAFLRNDDCRYELWEGELWRMSPTKKRHGRGTTRIAMSLGRYVETNPIGSLYLGEVGFRVGPRQTLVCPDVVYVSQQRDAPVDDDDFFPYAPDLAVEVLSPDKTLPRVRRKARAYLASGAQLVWAIDPRRQAVTVDRPGVPAQILRGQVVLDGEAVLPGFTLRVADLFR